MLLNYFALLILVIGLVLIFYTFIYIHDLPYQAAKKRNHPQTEAIHVACWLSLFTLHAIWPIVYIWAISKSAPGVAVAKTNEDQPDIGKQLSQIEARLQKLEHKSSK